MARNDVWHRQNPFPTDGSDIEQAQWREAHEAACDCDDVPNHAGESPEDVLKAEKAHNLDEAVRDCD